MLRGVRDREGKKKNKIYMDISAPRQRECCGLADPPAPALIRCASDQRCVRDSVVSVRCLETGVGQNTSRYRLRLTSRP